MLGPKRAAFLYVRRVVQHLSDPLIVSWEYNTTPETTTGSRFIDLLQGTGIQDPTAALTIPTAIQFMQEHNGEEVRIECHSLLRQAIERICDITNMSPLDPFDSDFYCQMGIAPLPLSNLTVLKRRLYDEYKIEIPLVPWPNKQFIRISIQGYNTQGDIEALINALKALLPQAAL